MLKYWHVFQTGLQNTLVYRAQFFVRILFGFIPLTATILLWKTVYATRSGGGSIEGYTFASMCSYYLIVTMVDALTAVNEDDWQIAQDIRDGQISQFLLKPIDYLTYRLCLFFSGRVIYSITAIIPVSVFVFCLRRYFVLPADGVAWGAFLISLVLTALLQFFMSYTMALLAFWVLEVSTFIFIVFAFEYLAGGHLFPLDILPKGIMHLLFWTPFPYQLFFPISIYLGQTTGRNLWTGLIVQAGWTLLAYAVARGVWSRGIRKYSAVGG